MGGSNLPLLELSGTSIADMVLAGGRLASVSCGEQLNKTDFKNEEKTY